MEKRAFEAVDAGSRDSALNIAMVWLGSMICIPSLLEGGAKIERLSAGGLFWSALIGYSLLSVVIYFQGAQGADLGLPTDKLSESSFGKKGGNFIVSSVIALSLIGWFGIQTAITGRAIAEILSVYNISVSVTVMSIVCGVLMMINAIYGYKSMVFLNKVSVPALLILCSYALYHSFKNLGLAEKVSFSDWFVLKDGLPSLLWGVDFSIGGLIVGATIASNYARFARNRRDVAISGFSGVVPAGVALSVIGGLMTLAAGTADITIVVGRMGYPVVALTILILATWTTNVGNAYSSGLSFTNMFNLGSDKRYLATALAGFLGIILAITGILDNFIEFLLFLTKGVTPVAGVMIFDYWILCKGKASRWHAKEGWYLPGVIAWALGFAVNYFISWGSQSVNSIVVSGLSYLILVKVFAAQKKHKDVAVPTEEVSS
ncbi:MAG: cytosine permease [Brevinema sp.]